jgi:hypothetical protein
MPSVDLEEEEIAAVAAGTVAFAGCLQMSANLVH